MSPRPRDRKGNIYFLFARLFREAPLQELLRAIVDHNLLTAARDFLKEGVTEKGEILEDPVWLEKNEAIALEFASLFLVPGENLISPYESCYCDTLTIDTSTACSAYFEPEAFPKEGFKGFLCGPSTRSVQKAYEAFGFELDPSFHDLPDHGAVELEFMGRLLSSGEYDQADRFFREHPGRWMAPFLGRLTEQSVSPFYRAVAQSLRGYLNGITALSSPGRLLAIP